LGSRFSDFPIAARVETRGPPGEWEERAQSSSTASAIETLVQLVGRDPSASVTLRIEPVETRAIRIRLGRDADRPAWNPWSIAEIHVYSRCLAPGSPAPANGLK